MSPSEIILALNLFYLPYETLDGRIKNNTIYSSPSEFLEGLSWLYLLFTSVGLLFLKTFFTINLTLTFH